MEPVADYPLDRGTLPPPPPREGRVARAAAVAVLVLIAVALLVFIWRRSSQSLSEGEQPAAPVAAESRRPLGPPAEPGPLPPLEETDPLVRQLVSALSSRPEVARWLATDGVIRNFVVTVDNVSAGLTPSRHLRRLAPPEPFAVSARGDRSVIDPRSYRRYDAIADVVASLDAAGLAALYSRLKPRLQEAYTELGHPAGDIDSAVEQAIVRLLQTPVVDGEIGLTSGVESFKYEDDDLEALTGAQKHLLRMGPRNVRLVQEELRAIARELGIPSTRLP